AGVSTAFGVAQKQAAAILRGIEGPGRVTAVCLAGRVEPVVEDETDPYTAAARIDALRIGLGAAPASAGLVWVRDSLKRTGMQGAEIYIFSDFQAHTWAETGDAAAAAGAFRALCAANDVYLVDVGSRPAFNYMVTDLRPAEWAMTVGRPVTFHAAVETWGRAPRDATATVTFLVDGLKKDVRTFAPSDRTVLDFDYHFAEPGEHLVDVVAEGDAHRVDNRRSYLCSVPERFKVLVIDESVPAATRAPETGGGASALPAGGPPLDVESAYLARAIEPVSYPGMAPVSRFTVKLVPPAACIYENLGDYAVIVMTQAAGLDASLVARLEGRVRDGGALWVFLGPNVNVYQYDKLLYRDGAGLLPARLGSGRATSVSASPDAAVYLALGDSDHPAAGDLAGFTGRDAVVTGGLEMEAGPGARPVFALSDGRPAMVEKPFGRGRVMVADFTAGAGWTRLPGTPEFPVMVQEILRYLVGNPDAAVNLDAGQPFEQPVFVSREHLLLRKPDGSKARLTPGEFPDHAGDAWFVRYDGTDQQGVYELLDVPEGVVPRTRFVVNQVASEGDLTSLDNPGFSERYGRGYRWVGPDTPVEDLAARLHAVTDFAPGILAALTALLAIEACLAWRFGRRRRRATTA
ncbi:MAG: hypothetical protein ACK2U9_16270, partial [Anaerolineae bacterium]